MFERSEFVNTGAEGIQNNHKALHALCLQDNNFAIHYVCETPMGCNFVSKFLMEYS